MVRHRLLVPTFRRFESCRLRNQLSAEGISAFMYFVKCKEFLNYGSDGC